jgi:hypothetical protein
VTERKTEVGGLSKKEQRKRTLRWDSTHLLSVAEQLRLAALQLRADVETSESVKNKVIPEMLATANWLESTGRLVKKDVYPGTYDDALTYADEVLKAIEEGRYHYRGTSTL